MKQNLLNVCLTAVTFRVANMSSVFRQSFDSYLNEVRLLEHFSRH